MYGSVSQRLLEDLNQWCDLIYDSNTVVALCKNESKDTR